MGLVLKHIEECYLDFPLTEDFLSSNWTFNQHLQSLGPRFYTRIVPHHLTLNYEYSIICSQLRSKLLAANEENEEQLKEQLIAALVLAELMEQIYLNYLDVPREVQRLRKHKKVYRELLSDWKGYTFVLSPDELDEINIGYSIAQQIRNLTALTNVYRQFFVRIKRLLDMIDNLGTNSVIYQKFIEILGKGTNRVLPHIAWLFFLPRLLSNLFLIGKHTIPGSWMSEGEKSLDIWTRFGSQFQRRWFELGNDSIWVAVGLVNCFVLVGALSPVGSYINFIFFGYDVVIAAVRAYIEINRLSTLREEYRTLLDRAEDQGERDQINELLDHLEERIQYEQKRLGINVAATVFLLIAVFFSIPALAFNPIFPLIGSIILVATTAANYFLTQRVEEDRPKDAIEKPTSPAAIGFFRPRSAVRSANDDIDELALASHSID